MDKDGEKLLLCGVCNGDEEVEKMLVERFDVDHNTQDGVSQTPVLIATGHRHEGVWNGYWGGTTSTPTLITNMAQATLVSRM